MTGMPVVDAHQHVWDVSAHPQPWLASDEALAPLRRNFALADLAPLAAAEGVTATVVVQTVTEPWETPELLALADGGGLVAGVVGWWTWPHPMSRTRSHACANSPAAAAWLPSGIRC